MKCIICNGPADKMSIYVAGKDTSLILGNPGEGKQRHVLFGICSNHLTPDGDFAEGIEAQVKQLILRRVREPGVPEFDGIDQLNEFLESENKPPEE